MAEKTDAEILESLNLEPDSQSKNETEDNNSRSIEDTQKELEELAGFGNLGDDNKSDDNLDELLSNSELTALEEATREDPLSFDKRSEEAPENIVEDNSQDSSENTPQQNEDLQKSLEEEQNRDDAPAQEEPPLDEESFKVQKKQTLIRKILLGLIGFLGVVILLGAILYFMGFFDPEPPKPTPEQIKAQAKAAAAKIEEETKYKFKNDDINVERLNKRLNLLTKYEIIESEEKERMKDDERAKFEQMNQSEQQQERQKQLAKIKEQEELRMKEMIEAAKEQARAELLAEQLKQRELEAAMQEEEARNEQKKLEEKALEAQEEAPQDSEPKQEQEEENTSTNEVVENQAPTEQEQMQEKPTEPAKEEQEVIKETVEEKPTMIPFLKFISIETNNSEVFLNDIKPVEMVDRSFKLCRDNRNNVEIIIGPFEEDENRQMILEEFTNKKINAMAVDYPEEEYDRRCNY